MAKSEIVENNLNFIEDELEIRIESIKIALDLAYDRILSDLDFHESELIKYNNNKKIINKRYLKRRNGLKRFLEYKNQELLNMLKLNEKLFLNFHLNSNFVTDPDVGRLCWLKLPKLEKLNFETSFKRLNLRLAENDNVYKVSPYFKSLCVLNRGSILFSDYKNNEILRLDSDFICKELYSTIDCVSLDKPCSMCTNDSGTVIYLINFGNQEIYITNCKLSIIQRKLTKYEFGLLFFPLDCTFYKNSLFIIDHGYYRVLKLTEQGDFEKEFLLFNSEPQDYNDFLVWPLKIQVTSNIIAILDDWSYIYLYDFNGLLKQIIGSISIYSSSTKRIYLPEDSDIQTFIIFESYMLFHSSNGSISVFFEQRGKFIFLLKKFFNGLNNLKYTHFGNFNGQLIMTIKDEKRIVLI